MDSFQILAFGIAILFYGANAAETWGYFGSIAADKWKDIAGYELCGTGKKQSPINIQTANLKKMDFSSFTLSNYDTATGLTLKLINNGHTAQVDLAEGHDITLSGGGLPGTYVPLQFHFHWGKDSTTGSEHTIDNKQYAMEIHIVHKKQNVDITTALGQSDGLAVLGFMVEEGPENAAWNKITDKLASVSTKDAAAVELDAASLASFIPTNKGDFYRYAGGLTTPGCSEAVVWTLFTQTIKISRAQLDKFRAIMSGENNNEGNKLMYDNYRPVQPLYNRTVYSTADPSGAVQTSISVTVLLASVTLTLLHRF